METRPGRSVYRSESFLGSVTSIYLLYGLNYLFPLLVAPLLAARYGVSKWGTIAVELSLGQIAATLVDYGFSVSAVRDCALCSRLDESKLLYWQVSSAKLSLAILLVSVFLGVLAFGSSMRSGALTPLLALLWGIVQGFSPGWYFQATGRFRQYVSIEGGAKLLLALALLSIRPQGNENLFVISAFLVASLLSFAINTALTIGLLGLPVLSFSMAASGLRKGFPMFAFRGLATLYTTVNVPFVGYLLGSGPAGTYALVERLVRGIQGLVGPLGQVLLPRMSRLVHTEVRAARTQMLGITICCVSLASAFTLIVFWNAALIAPAILKLSDATGAGCLRAMAGLIPLGVLTHLLGIQWLIPSRDDKYFLRAISCGALVNFALLPLLAHFFGIIGASFNVVIVESFVAVLFLARIVGPVRGPKSGRDSFGDAAMVPAAFEARLDS
jgi:PST family polysaccharide transporter